VIGKAMWVSCDYPACDDTFEVQGRQAIVRIVRREAHAEGWTRRHGKDVCPTHRAPEYGAILDAADES